MTPLHVLITMDVEPVKQLARWTGPTDVETSARYICAYWRTSVSYGYPVSFFVHPEIAGPHAQLLHELQRDDACLGLHLHAAKFQHPMYSYELGYYTASQQYEMLSNALEQWSSALDQTPLYFRPGAFSANDATFQTLVDLGFRGGSVSIPERVWPGRYCVWAGAVKHPHRPHAAFRLVQGDLPFANIPLSVDHTQRQEAAGLSYCMDLRPEIRQCPVEQILERIVKQLAENMPQTPVLHVVTHNDQPYDAPTHPSTARFSKMLELIEPLCEKYGFSPVPATIASVSDRVLAQSIEPAQQWDQPNNPTDVQ